MARRLVVIRRHPHSRDRSKGLLRASQASRSGGEYRGLGFIRCGSCGGDLRLVSSQFHVFSEFCSILKRSYFSMIFFLARFSERYIRDGACAST